MWNNRNRNSLLVGMQIVQSLWKTAWRFITKLNILLIGFSNATPWYLPKGVENVCPYQHQYTDVYSGLVKIAKTCK